MTRSDRSDEGFTLLELVVCLGLLALTATWLLQGAPILNRAVAVMARAEEEDGYRAAEMHLRRALERTVPYFTVAESGDAKLVFDGQAASLSFVTRSDGRLEAGGFIAVELRTEDLEGGLALVAERNPLASFAAGGTEPEAITLLQGVAGVNFRYYGPQEPQGATGWSPDWAGRSALPWLVQIGIERPGGHAPAESFVVALPAASTAAPGG